MAEDPKVQAEEVPDARSRIERAIAGDGLVVVFQPIVEIASARVVGFEALSRFPGASPASVFAEAARAGLGVELEAAAIRAALPHIQALPTDAYVSVNVSPDLALSGRLPALLAGAPLERIVIEITETAQVDDYEALERALWGLRSRGVRLAVDDAGAGYSGMVQILKLRPEIIKLDIAVTRGVDRDVSRQALVSSLVSFGDRIHATIVAEGVETPQESAMLEAIGVRCAQGYLTGKPAPVAFLPARTDATPGHQYAQRREVRAAVKRHRRVVARPRRHMRAVALAVLTSALLVPASAVMAADAEPGGSLYSVKLFVEDLRLTLERDPGEDLALHVEFASRRVEELTTLLAARADESLVASVAARLQRHVAAVSGGIGRLGSSARTDALRERVAALLSLDGSRLGKLVSRRCPSGRTSRGCSGLGVALSKSSAVVAQASRPASSTGARNGTAAAAKPSANAKPAGTSKGGPPTASPPAQVHPPQTKAKK